MTVRQLLEQKDPNLWTIDPDATVFDALAKMAEKDIGSLVVMDGEELIGIVTERHYSRNVILKGKTSPTTSVRDIMDKNVIHVRPEQSVELCMALMTDKRVRHLAVLEGKKVIGIISIGDLLKSIISKQLSMNLNTTFMASAVQAVARTVSADADNRQRGEHGTQCHRHLARGQHQLASSARGARKSS